jgi:hypothetical protein
MSCCGNQRNQLNQNQPGSRINRPAIKQVNSPGTSEPPNVARYSAIFFEYYGKTGMTVWGQSTGKRYRFDGPGSRVIIDPRDRPSLAIVPQLKQVMI